MSRYPLSPSLAAILTLFSTIEQQCRLLYFFYDRYFYAHVRGRELHLILLEDRSPSRDNCIKHGTRSVGWCGAVKRAEDGESRGGFQFYDPEPLLIPFFFRLLYSSFYSPLSSAPKVRVIKQTWIRVMRVFSSFFSALSTVG